MSVPSLLDIPLNYPSWVILEILIVIGSLSRAVTLLIVIDIIFIVRRLDVVLAYVELFTSGAWLAWWVCDAPPLYGYQFEFYKKRAPLE